MFDPLDNVRRAVLDADVSRLRRTKEQHRVTIDKRDVGEIDRYRCVRVGFIGEQAFDFRQVLFRQLSAEPDFQRLFFPGWTDLQQRLFTSYLTSLARAWPQRISRTPPELMFVDSERFDPGLQRRCRNAQPSRRAIGARYAAARFAQYRFNFGLRIAAAIGRTRR